MDSYVCGINTSSAGILIKQKDESVKDFIILNQVVAENTLTQNVHVLHRSERRKN